jgi:hypothetical protein
MDSTTPSLVFGVPVALPRLDGPGSSNRLSGVRLTGLASRAPVGLVDPNDPQPVVAQVLEQAGPVGASAFHPDRNDVCPGP